MVRSLISQLLQQCVEIPPNLETLFSFCLNGQRQPSLDDLLGALHQTIQKFAQLYFILDALDECNNRVELTEVLESIAGWQLSGLHLLVTSRKEQDIEQSLAYLVNSRNTICLQSDLVDVDIRSYVNQRLSVDKNLRKWQKDSNILLEIETTLIKGAHGMYVHP